MRDTFKNVMEKNWFCYTIILFFSALMCIPLLSRTIDLFQDDGIQHICRLIGTAQSLGEQSLFPVIMSDFCNGFGYSWNLFYSILTAYVPLLFRFLGASYLDCIKLFLYLLTALSGFSMFAFTKRVTKSKKIALLASVFYILLPYRVTDMYMRIAIAELASFVFLPMVFHGIYAILEDCQGSQEKPMNLVWVAGTVGLMLSHTVITLYTAIFAFLYLVIQYKKLNKKAICQLGISLLLILLLCAFFLIPLLEHRLVTEYEVFQKGRMSRVEVLEYYKLNLSELFFTQEGFIFEIGGILLLGSIFAILAIAKKKIQSDEKRQTIFFLVMGILCSILTLRIVPFEKLPEILCMIQFTYRFLEFVGFFLSFAAAVGVVRLFKRYDLGDLLVITTLAFLLIVPLNRFISYDNRGWTEDKLIPAVPVNENTQRVHAGCASFEYLPTKAFQNLEYIKEREPGAILLSGEAEITGEAKERNITGISFIANTKELSVELPYIYYLGYTIRIRSAETEEWQEVQGYESEKGFLTVNLAELEEGKEYEILVWYRGTMGMKISLATSLITTIALLFEYGIYFSKKRKKALEKIDEPPKI